MNKKVVCVNNRRADLYYVSSSEFFHLENLEVGKVYTVINENDMYYYISDHEGGFFKERFITLQEYRKLKLQEINESSNLSIL